MPEKTREQAAERAEKVGIPTSQVVKGKAGYFIAPAGIKNKRVYAALRSVGNSKEKSAKIAWSLQNKS